LAISAIQHIGTNALPVALKLCGAKDSWAKMQLADWTERFNDGHFPKRFPVRIIPAWAKQAAGANIICALGPAANPAIPPLIQLLQSKDRSIAETAGTALLGTSTNAIPPLLELLNNPRQEIRLRAAFVLGDFCRIQKFGIFGSPKIVAGSDDFRSKLRAAVPVLLQGLDNEGLDAVTRIRVIYALGVIGEDAPAVVPAIVRHIQIDTNNMIILSDYIRALGNFGTNAKPAVPLLIQIIQSRPEQPYLSPPQAAALITLQNIDPETAKPFMDRWNASRTNEATSKHR
jgi:HEAT repeat protein